MEKKLVGLYVPAIQKSFDILVPADLAISALTELLSKGVSELCSGRYIFFNQKLMTLRDQDILLRPEKTLADYGIGDGAQLVLF